MSKTFTFYNPKICKSKDFSTVDFDDIGTKSNFLNGYFSSYKNFQIKKSNLLISNTNYTYYIINEIEKKCTYEEFSFESGYICIGELSKVLFEISKLWAIYTDESIKAAMAETPLTYQYVRHFGDLTYKNIYINLRGGKPVIKFFNKVYACRSSDYSVEAKTVIEFINLIISELYSHKIDCTKFIKKEVDSETPKWLINILKIGSKIAIKSILANIDFDIDNGDDYTIDESNIDVNSINIDQSDPLNLNNEDFSSAETNRSNVSFRASKSSLESDLRQAQTDIDYYERKIRNMPDDATDNYKSNCLASLKYAIKKANDIKNKLNNL